MDQIQVMNKINITPNQNQRRQSPKLQGNIINSSQINPPGMNNRSKQDTGNLNVPN